MQKKSLKKEIKLSNIVQELDYMSEIICTLDHKFPAEADIHTLYSHTLRIKKLLLETE